MEPVPTVGSGGGGPSPAPAPLRPPALQGAVLKDVRLVHTSLGQGGRSSTEAIFAAPDAAGRLHLQARLSEGEVWKVPVRGDNATHVVFETSCSKDRPRHADRWAFSLVDEEGHRSNIIERTVECTGEPVPGAPPHLAGVDLASRELPVGGRTSVVARVDLTHPPFIITVTTRSAGNYWSSGPGSRVFTNGSFSVGCDGRMGSYLMDLEFRARDTYGRESNVVKQRVICGDCR
jgi:hypothetical protein